MIDRKLLRNSESIKKIKESEKKRFNDLSNLERSLELDEAILKKEFDLRQICKNLNKLNSEIKNIYKFKKKDENEESKNKVSLQQFIEQKNQFQLQKDEETKKLLLMQHEFDEVFKKIGNILHKDVVVSNTEDDNPVVANFVPINPVYKEISKNLKENDLKTSLENLSINGLLTHDKIMQKLNGLEMQRGAKIAGHRGYFLQNEIALLQNSLARYAIDFAVERNLLYIQPPVLINGTVMKKTCQLSDFEENLYCVRNENETDKFLVATSEQPISGFFMDERIKEADLPIKFAGDSLCFRKEAGAHGKDNLGIFRIHQFQKIELFYVTNNDSEKYHKEMVEYACDFLKSLDIEYKLIGIVSGALNDAAAIKYDIEAFFPGSNTYRELNSISNCTDYQSRNLNIRKGIQKIDGEKEYVHMLNGTLCAVHRSLCCILENYQTKEGIRIPKVLQKYMGGKEFLEYKK